MLSRLSIEERELIFLLTPDFLHCVLSVQDEAISDLMHELEKRSAFLPGHKVYFLPLLKQGDEKKSKSGHAAVYAVKAKYERQLKAAGIDPSFSVVPSTLLSTRATRKNATIIYLDDFVGSGSTAESAFDLYVASYSAKSDKFFIGAFVAQAAAVAHLKNLGAVCVAGMTRHAGIGDSTRIADKDAARLLMRALSTRIGQLDANVQLGFNSAEALVSLTRCPNNTFPVYWSSRDVGGSPWPAPFQR